MGDLAQQAQIKLKGGEVYARGGEVRRIKTLFNGRGGSTQIAYWNEKGELKTTSPKKFRTWINKEM